MRQNKIQLNPLSILSVPIQSYQKDFTFFINHEEYKTSRLMADLLSPIICQNHIIDPTICDFTINTQHQGDFSHFIKLFNFESNQYPSKETEFIQEVIEKLGNEFIEHEIEDEEQEITVDNVFALIKKHEKHSKIYNKKLTQEIEFISSHFYELCENKKDEFAKINIETLSSIISHNKLQLNNEDQLMKFANGLYKEDNKYEFLYENILFEHVSIESIIEFISIFDKEDMSNATWQRISKRLCYEIIIKNDIKIERYREIIKSRMTFTASNQKEFNGILRHFINKTNNQIQNEITISASSESNISSYPVRNIISFDDPTKRYYSYDRPNSWICIDFRDHRIVPTAYTIRSYELGIGYCHPKSWVIEASNNNEEWETIDEEKDCSILNKSNVVHTFMMNHPTSNEYKYIRMRQTGLNWQNDNQLVINCFEVYGQLI